jgi:SSS family transporter
MANSIYFQQFARDAVDATYANMRCDTFTTNPCTTAEANTWDRIGASMGFSDFIPSTVNWNVPTPWRGTSGSVLCSDLDMSGCPMPLAGGYGIVLGLGALFTVLTIMCTFLERRVSGKTVGSSEHFNTAGRNIKTGLTASVIVSQWTWAATLLQSSNKAWQLGISGPFWYASGATIQVLLFGIIAIEVKRKCPNAHTFLEIIDARWGTAAHMTFLVFAFITNFLVTGMLLLGGGAVLQDYAGMNKIGASFLIPFGIVGYTVFGGLKATFMAGYLHTCMIMCGLVSFISAVYLSGPDIIGCKPNEQCNAIGSAGNMYERLAFIIQLDPSITNVSSLVASQVKHGPAHPTNQGGSYLTMMSGSGLMFGVINTVGNFGTVFVDQSYWQSAIAASPASAHKGYLAGGLVWFTIPFALATSLGLAGVALNGAIRPEDAGAGLVPPAAATMLLGSPGGTLMIIMLFMAITSTGSAECIAVSSLVTYDIYRKYVNPAATNDQIMMWSRVVTLCFGLVMGSVAAIFAAIQIPMLTPDDNGNAQFTTLSMGWVYVFMGNAIGSAVAPVFFSITWKDANKWGAICGAWGGLIGSMTIWVISTAAIEGDVNYFSLSTDLPLLISNLTAILLSAAIHIAFSLVQPQNYNWKDMNEHIKVVEGCAPPDIPEEELTEAFLGPALAWSWKYGGWTSIFLLVVWPLLFSFPWGVLPKGVYALWVSVAFAWGWLGAIWVVSAPVVEYFPFIKAALTCTTVKGETSTVPAEKTGVESAAA